MSYDDETFATRRFGGTDTSIEHSVVDRSAKTAEIPFVADSLADAGSTGPKTAGGPPPPPELTIGTRYGNYLITGVLGRGGMGVVYEARNIPLARPAAVKVMSAAMQEDERRVGRFLREAQAIARLDHPNVVGIYEVGRFGGAHFIAMPLLTGGSADAKTSKREAYHWPEATRIIADACRGAAAAHRAGIIHRDIKPANILFAADGTAKLADFGLAKPTADNGQDGSNTRGGVVLGTANYLSPEQARAEAVDVRTDVYQLGATYFALLTGRPPYTGYPIQVLHQHCSAPVPDPRDLVPTIPAACAEIVLRAMAKRPADRYPSAERMLADVELAYPALQAATGGAEAARLAALRRYEILDTETEPAFDDFVALAARICGVPISVISLVDAERQWFKARVGLDGARQTPRDIAFCSHAIAGRELMVVPDAAADARFAANPLVTGDPNIRFYAGAPLINPDGFALGTLCVIDRSPRTLTPEQSDALRMLARQVMAQLELRLNVAERRRAEERMARFETILEATPDFVGMADTQGRTLYVNRGGRRMTGLPDAGPIDRRIPDFHPPWAARLATEIGLPAALRDGVWEGESALLGPDGREIPCSQVILSHRTADGGVTHFSTIMRELPRGGRPGAAAPVAPVHRPEAPASPAAPQPPSSGRV